MAIIQKALEPFDRWEAKPLIVRSSAGAYIENNSPIADKEEKTTAAKITTEAVTAPASIPTPTVKWGLKATPDTGVDSTYLDNTNSINLNWNDPRHREKLLKIQRGFEWSGKGSDVSKAGAVGPAQFMPATWEDMKSKGWVPKNASRRNPYWAAQAQEKYMDWIYTQPGVKDAPTEAERVKRMIAAYNNGIGNVANAVAASKADGYPNNWYRYLSKGSQKETINYTQNILKRFSSDESGSLLVTRKHGGILYNNSNNKNR